jgi:two-component system, sensor histidine kinase YesM
MLKKLLLIIYNPSASFLKNRGQWLKDQPLIIKLIVINFVLIALALGTASYLTFSSYASSMEKNIGKYQMDVVNELTANIDTYINEFNLLSLMPYQSRDILQYIASSKTTFDTLSFNERVNLEGFSKNVFANGRVDISGLTLYSATGGTYTVKSEAQPYFSFKDVKKEPWYSKVSNTGKMVYVKSENGRVSSDKSQVYSFARKIRSVENGKDLGYIVLDVDMNIIRNKIETLSNDKKNIMILDDAGDLVYKSMDQQIDEKSVFQYKGSGTVKYRENKVTELLSFHTSPLTGWMMIEMVPLPTLLQDTVRVRNYIVLIGLICLLLAVLISTAIAVRITYPISELRNLMKKVVRGDLEVSLPINSRDEIGQLSQSFNIMVSKLSELGYRLYESEIREKNSQIAALQSQINPHFLYNTLGSISMYAEIQGNREVVKMTNNLSKLLRYSINSQNNQVPLQMELEHVKGYMAIQQIRFEDKIKFHVEMEPDILSCLVIRFVLQPIVENCIIHGFEKGNGYGTIKLNGEKKDGNIMITIQDDGVGMSPEQLQKLRDHTANREDETGGHGLTNVHRRIVLRYGDQFGLTINSSYKQGTTVNLTLPLIDAQ